MNQKTISNMQEKHFDIKLVIYIVILVQNLDSSHKFEILR